MVTTSTTTEVSGAHTPGPWLRIDTADYAEIHAAFRPSSQAVALVGKPEDANLIAGAPELLAAVYDAEWALAGMLEADELGEECLAGDEQLLCGADCCEQSGCAVGRLTRLRAAIAKATGAA